LSFGRKRLICKRRLSRHFVKKLRQINVAQWTLTPLI
jgi:hypothetical protein